LLGFFFVRFSSSSKGQCDVALAVNGAAGASASLVTSPGLTQSFLSPPTASQVCSIRVRLLVSGTPSITLSLRTDVFGSGTELDTKSLSPGTLVAETDVTFTFDSPVAISASTVYFIGLSVPALSVVSWSTSVGDTYADGSAYTSAGVPVVPAVDYTFLVTGTAAPNICGNPIVFNVAAAVIGSPVFQNPYQSLTAPAGALSMCGGSIRLLASVGVSTSITISLHSAEPPSGANELATSTATYAVLALAEEYAFTFASPTSVTSGSVYFLAVTSADLTVTWQYSALNKYPEGSASGGFAAALPLGSDFRFILRGVTDAECGNLIAQNDGPATGFDLLALAGTFIQSFTTLADTDNICGGTIRLLVSGGLPILDVSFTATLRETDPTGPILATVTVSDLQILTVAADYHFEFPPLKKRAPGIPVDPNTIYFLQISADNPLVAMPYTIGTSYLGGQAFVNGAVTVGQDYIFSMAGSPSVVQEE
jgi:hypothetical protein